MTTNGKPNTSICLYLGLGEDQGTRFTFPSEENCCHRARPVQRLSLDYQTKVCLNENHFEACPIFAKGWTGALPVSMKLKQERNLGGFSRWFWPLVAVMTTLAVIVVSWLYSQDISRLQGQVFTLEAQLDVQEFTAAAMPAVPEPSATQDVLSVLLPTATEGMTATPEDTPTPEPTPTISPTPYKDFSSLAVGPHFGPYSMFVIHEVVYGDSLPAIARSYETTTELISALNTINGPIHVGDFLVIAPGLNAIPDFPPLVPMYIDRETAIAELVEDYCALVEDFLYFNGWGEVETVAPRTYVIVPNYCDQ